MEPHKTGSHSFLFRLLFLFIHVCKWKEYDSIYIGGLRTYTRNNMMLYYYIRC